MEKQNSCTQLQYSWDKALLLLIMGASHFIKSITQHHKSIDGIHLVFFWLEQLAGSTYDVETAYEKEDSLYDHGRRILLNIVSKFGKTECTVR